MSEFRERKSLEKAVEEFAGSLCKLNLLTPEETFNSGDPLVDLEHLHNQAVSILSSTKAPEIECSEQNESVVLECIRNLSSASEELLQLSTLLYGQFPLEVLRSFRKAMQSLNTASYSLFEFCPLTRHAEQQKTELLTRNLELSSRIEKNFQQQNPSAAQSQRPQEDSSNRQSQIRQLKQEVDELQQLIKQNDEQFSIEIQRYNHALVDLQETLREYEVRLDRTKELENSLEEMEHRMIRMKEEKCRDDMLIENMSKKIRIYEKERGGAEVFLSPRHRKLMGSPSSRFRSPNLSAINSFDAKRTYLRTEQIAE